jgi:hypothetical protein
MLILPLISHIWYEVALLPEATFHETYNPIAKDYPITPCIFFFVFYKFKD